MPRARGPSVYVRQTQFSMYRKNKKTDKTSTRRRKTVIWGIRRIWSVTFPQQKLRFGWSKGWARICVRNRTAEVLS